MMSFQASVFNRSLSSSSHSVAIRQVNDPTISPSAPPKCCSKMIIITQTNASSSSPLLFPCNYRCLNLILTILYMGITNRRGPPKRTLVVWEKVKMTTRCIIRRPSIKDLLVSQIQYLRKNDGLSFFVGRV